MEGMTENFRMKYSPTDKRKLGDIAKAVSENESEVVRRLIRYAYDKLMTAAFNSYIVGEKVSMGTFDLDSVLDGSEHEEITRALMRISTYYAAGQLKDEFMKEILDVVFANDPAKLERSKKVFDAYMRDWYFADDERELSPERMKLNQEMMQEYAEMTAREHMEAQEADATLAKVRTLLRKAHNGEQNTLVEKPVA